MRDELVSALWYGDGVGVRAARAALTPLEWLYGAASRVHGVSRARAAGAAAVPTISVGNITVGGTGKTPLSAWVASELQRRGARPAMLLRGYGGDEPRVHAVLNPSVPVFADSNRARSAALAVRDGATALVLDDAFQHRQLARDADIVLVSADQWHDGPVRLLPAGPFREPLSALQRASLIVVTRKAASRERADAIAATIGRSAPAIGSALVHLAPASLRAWHGAEEPLDCLKGQRVLAVSGIAAPGAFAAQLRALGATIDVLRYSDHHAFSAADQAQVQRRAAACDRVVCTLKDAVKLGPLWPADAPALWYLSQSPLLERGGDALHALIDRVLSRSARRLGDALP